MKSDTFWRYATLAPAVILFVLLTILPLFNLLALSFHDVEWLNREAVWEWVGGRNYAKLPEDTLFNAGILNTIIFAVLAVAFQMVLGFWLALMTTRVTRLRVFYRAVFILPILVPGIIIGAIWKLMYSYDFGVINQAVVLFGGNPVDWLGNPRLALMSVIIVDVWHWTPFCFLLMLASLESLPQDIFEAAEIDGASKGQVLRYIILPLMMPAIIVTFIFRMILAFKVFDEIYLLTGGGPGTSTEVISFTIYRRFFTEDQSGYGSAMSLATIAVIATMIILASRFATKKGPDA
ncbi:carbohydrate ABC transporter permease [Tropicimonas sediminicola]|uniref:Multiple sugar transport system permease protein n=1 Tax=Tropicimonas sediminicola TaxID=1031541 RepID=A0A239LLS9_9RHOB|nr:sugar ABC transporter permease [Tropicimonas sediminicola]SNT30629.1 multiple sugar transport system permease protein [Tropicimonas sediminicola]